MGGERVFVTGAAGFIGASLLRAATAAGYGVDALTRSEASAAALRAQGVNAVIGDLADPDGGLASYRSCADAIVHLAQPQTFGGRVTTARAKRYANRPPRHGPNAVRRRGSDQDAADHLRRRNELLRRVRTHFMR